MLHCMLVEMQKTKKHEGVYQYAVRTGLSVMGEVATKLYYGRHAAWQVVVECQCKVTVNFQPFPAAF